MNRNLIRIIIIVAVVLIIGIILYILINQFSANKEDAGSPVVISKLPTANTAKSDMLQDARMLLQSGQRAESIRKLEEVTASNKGTQDAYEAFLMLADAYNRDGNFIKAKEIYLTIINDYSQYCNYADMHKNLASINMKILFSRIPTPDSEIYTVAPGDALSKIAKKYSTTVDLIKKANNLQSDLILPGMRLKVQKIPFSIIVDKSQATLTLLLGDEVIKTYIVSTGKNNSTPVGEFKIKDKLVDPVWYNQGAVVPADSPENVLGTRWMGLTTPVPGYGIHGTIEPESIGYQCTEGCVRMKNEEVEELFSLVPPGTKVTIVD